uniref:ubiquitinyl hydrolase 1 n=1 Tax=Callorhinchus milii TaxID=7868 RepID=A0A4W3K929_CALMI
KWLKMANVTESGRRRLGRNQEEATSKKKLKDKVNQENKEGKNAVSSEPKKDLFSEWKQNADEVIVKLKLGEGAVKVDDIDAAFTDTDCVVTLPDGRQWSCQFHEEIESSCSKVQYKEKGNILQLLVQKKIPLHTWPSLWHYVNLSFVKYDSYEKGTDSMVVHVYVKEICKSTSKVLFREQDFTLIFQTRHNVFLRLHPGCGPNTIFKWQVKVRNLLNPEQCMYTFTASRIDICLKKRQNQRWGGLEALAAQGAVGGAKVAVPAGPPSLDKAQPGSSQHALPPKEEPRPSDKEKVRSEEASLDSVAVRSGPESVQIKQDALLTLPKPTCMVTPMTHSLASGEQAEEEEEEKKVCLPGFTGLVNLGNTCFMNSVIQSLSNTRELRDYFHDRSFETEINYNNPLGTGGRLAIGFAVLLQALWKGTHHAYQPSKLKAIVASKASQFTGYAQHDAQEFMAFLLDGLHEDLNRIQNKPYTETVDSDGRLDEVVAEEAWDRHKMRNDSFIVDLFQGQYKSKLVSITFDPFLYLPVPLPQKQKVLTVYFFAKEPHKKPVKILVSVSKENSNASDVLDAISRNLKVKVETLRLTEVVRNRFHRIFEPCQSLENTSPSDTLLCFEVLTKELAKEQVVELQVQQRLMVPKIPINKCAACHKPQQPDEKLRRCTSCYRVAYCNQTCQVNHWTDHKNQCRPENIGYPFLISVPKSRLTFSRLTQLLEGYSRYSVNVFQPPFQAGRITPEPPPSKPDAPPLVSANVSSAETGEKKLPPTAEVQERDFKPELNMPAKDRDSVHSYDSGFSESRTESHEDSGCEKETSYEKAAKPEAAVPGYQQRAESARSHTSQFHIKFIDSSRKEEKVDDKGDMPLEFPDCVSLAMIWKNNERQKEYVLVESRELEYMEDPCSASDAARAGYFTLEQCLNLFTKPEVLAPEEAWYCPKCKQHREASKQLMLWRLPNVLIIQLKRFSFRNFIWRDKINDMVEFPIRNLDLSKFCIGQKDDRQQPIYDLYAVINHYGGMIGGHYTAYARLPSDKNSQRSDVGWRLFDDSTVTTVDESQVAARHAYVLFYRRRNSPVVRPVRTRAGGRGAECATGADRSFHKSQASLIWQELEAEETGDETSHSADRHTQGVRPLRTRISEELSATPLPDYSDEDCIKYFVLSTLAAMIALFVNLLYPLII